MKFKVVRKGKKFTPYSIDIENKQVHYIDKKRRRICAPVLEDGVVDLFVMIKGKWVKL